MVLFEPVTAILDKTVSSGRTLNGIIFFDAQNSICLFPKKGSNLIGGSVFIYLQRLERDDFFNMPIRLTQVVKVINLQYDTVTAAN